MLRAVKLAAIVALLISGLWAAAATGVRYGYTRVIEIGATDGLTAMADALSISGFPLRIDAALTRPALGDAAAGWAWRGESLALSAALWQPTRLRLDAPGGHSVETGEQTVTLHSERLRAQIHVSASTSPRLRDVRLSTEAVEAVSAAGWRLALGSGDLHVEHAATDDAPHRYRVGLAGAGLGLPADTLRRLDSDGHLPPAIRAMAAAAYVTLDRPLDMATLQAGAARPDRIEIEDLSLDWGTLALAANGTLQVGPGGAVTGEVEVTATNWRQLIGLAAAAGLIRAEARQTIVGALAPLAARNDDPATLRTEISLRADGVYVWPVPVPLMVAPRL